MPKYSIIIPLYNRPVEIDELLQSLTLQDFTDFEVIVVEDGSAVRAQEICEKYASLIEVKYFYKENEGPGKARNHGCEKAVSGFFIFFDSDCLIPPGYLMQLNNAQLSNDFDAFGGPDAADESFTRVQKAINYSMTSLFTTGGIRGGKNSVEKFHPRSFNMGISREVFEKTKGFSAMRFGEDIDFSIRLKKEGFRAILLRECFVYHKRRTDFKKFFRQVFNSGVARINLYKRHPQSLKLFHFFPSAFILYFFLAVAASFLLKSIIPILPLVVYFLAVFADALAKMKSLGETLLAVWSAAVQLCGYGLGFIKGFWRRIILGKEEFHSFEKNFYK